MTLLSLHHLITSFLLTNSRYEEYTKGFNITSGIWCQNPFDTIYPKPPPSINARALPVE